MIIELIHLSTGDVLQYDTVEALKESEPYAFHPIEKWLASYDFLDEIKVVYDSTGFNYSEVEVLVFDIYAIIDHYSTQWWLSYQSIFPDYVESPFRDLVVQNSIFVMRDKEYVRQLVLDYPDMFQNRPSRQKELNNSEIN